MINRILIGIVALAASAFAQSDFAVVVEKSNPATHITKVQLRRMIMGEMNAWPGGGKVLIMLAASGDPARGAMLKQICGMSESDFVKYLAQKAFGGGEGAALKTLPSTAVVRQVVQFTPKSLGIVGAGDVNDTVKLLPVD
jgi:ABC-type phosphate transport system substrate-binding protein